MGDSLHATTVYLVRHAHAHWSTDDARPLSEGGAAAAEKLAVLLGDRPIVAIYSSPSRRAAETVAPLANRLGLPLRLIPGLRERELLPMPQERFEAAVAATWRFPDRSPEGAESNAVAQRRGMTALMDLVDRHPRQHLVVSTHGTLMALMMSAFSSSFGFEFWRQLTFPDVYQLDLEDGDTTRVARVWPNPA